MPRVKISIGDLNCVQQADSMGKDDVYWIANLRSGPSTDQKHTDMARLIYDEDYATSLPELAAVGTGETKRFTRNVVFDKDVKAGSYVFGTIHFLERDTPMSNFFVKLAELLTFIIGGLLVAGVVGFAIGWWLGGMTAAIGGAIMAILAVGLVGFFVGALIELTANSDNDAHLGGMKIAIGPLSQPPPNSDKDSWQLSLTPSGKLEVVDLHGAELAIYASSHSAHATRTGHKYQTAVQLEITGGHR